MTGASAFRSTAAIGVFGEKYQWNRGIVFANSAVAQSTFQDIGEGHDKSIDIRGQPNYGVYQSNPQTKNYFAGKTGFGDRSDFDSMATVDVKGDVHVSGSIFTARKTRKGDAVLHGVVVGNNDGATEVVHRGKVVLDQQGQASVPLGTSFFETVIAESVSAATPLYVRHATSDCS